MKKERELNVGRYITGAFIVSMICGFLFADNSGGVVAYVLNAAVLIVVIFFCLFWGGVIVTALLKIKVKDTSKSEAPVPVSTAPRHRPRRRRRKKKQPVTEDYFDDDYYDYIYGRGIYENKKPRSQMTFLERLRDNRGY